MKQHWALPKKPTLWLVFDLSNGDQVSHRYVWWFETRQAARDHIHWQKMRHQKWTARLSQPVKVIVPSNSSTIANILAAYCIK